MDVPGKPPLSLTSGITLFRLYAEIRLLGLDLVDPEIDVNPRRYCCPLLKGYVLILIVTQLGSVANAPPECSAAADVSAPLLGACRFKAERAEAVFVCDRTFPSGIIIIVN